MTFEPKTSARKAATTSGSRQSNVTDLMNDTMASTCGHTPAISPLTGMTDRSAACPDVRTLMAG